MVIFSKKQNNQVHLFLPMELTKLCILKPKKPLRWGLNLWACQQVIGQGGLTLSGGCPCPRCRLVVCWGGRCVEVRGPLFPSGCWRSGAKRSRQEVDQVLGLRGGKPEQRLPTCMGESSGEDTQLASSGALLSKAPETSLCSLHLSFEIILCTCKLTKIKYNVQKIQNKKLLKSLFHFSLGICVMTRLYLS